MEDEESDSVGAALGDSVDAALGDSVGAVLVDVFVVLDKRPA